jgi:proteasome lid subunit RPN8/RPN11
MTCPLSRHVVDDMREHAIAAFPEECCGIVVERDGLLQAVRVSNVQNQKHAEHPEQFPRTAATAYTMGPEALPILADHERGLLKIHAIYHSHPQHAAYFSEEDKRAATVWDEPSYPEAAQVVLSVIDRRVRDVKAFRWDAAARDFLEVALEIS